MARFLFAAMPFTGHVTPMTAVAGALVTRGHDVRFYTGSAFRDRVEASGAVFVPWRNAPDFDEYRLADTFPRLVGEKSLRQVFINLEDVMINTAPAQVADLSEEWAREPWDALVTEETSVGGALFAQRTGCARATVAVIPLNIAVTDGPPSGMGLTPGRNWMTKTRDAALRGLVPLLARPLQKPLARARADVGLPPSNDTFEKVVFSRELVLASGCPLLDYNRRGHPDHLRFVGELTAGSGSTAAMPPWWDDLDGRRIVHVTQGTQNIDPSDLIRPATEALAHENVLVVVATGERDRDTLPFAVPGNVRVGGILPYAQLLPRVDVMVTNGGWGGTLSALSHGIPLIIAGGDLDKPEVAARVAWSGAGVNLRTGRPHADQVRAAFERVVADPSIRHAAQRVGAQLRSLGGTPGAAESLETFAAGR